MKKIAYALLVFGTICQCEISFSHEANWNGFYVGGNAGYWESQANKITSTGSAAYINPAYQPGASNVANALAQMSDVSASLNSYGFIAGAEAGYNYELSHHFLLGLNIDIDGLTNSGNNITLRKSVNLADYNESYTGTFTVNQKINYLGSVRARFGYLFQPTLLIYATGGFAYSGVTLDTSWIARESLGAAVFPVVSNQRHTNNLFTGWVAGGGVEWLFKPNWSAVFEYAYYSLGSSNVPFTLSQTNASLSPPVLWGSAAGKTAVSLAVGDVRVGLNYHFL